MAALAETETLLVGVTMHEVGHATILILEGGDKDRLNGLQVEAVAGDVLLILEVDILMLDVAMHRAHCTELPIVGKRLMQP